MAVETTTTMICDRCGSRHDKAKLTTGNSWGWLDVAWDGHKGGRTYDGSAGGVNIKGKAWLCERCVDAFVAFMSGKVQPEAIGLASSVGAAYAQALANYPSLNPQLLQARKVCDGVAALAKRYLVGEG